MPPKKPELPELSAAQLELMEVVWERGEATVAEVWEAVSARRSIARNTVQTMLTRLEQKGWLTHRLRSGAFVFSAVADRAITLRRMASNLVDAAFGGSAENLVLTLLDGRKISSDEAARIRAAIEAAERGRK